VRRLRAAKALRAEILVGPLNDPNRLNGAGMIVVSPPWTLENKLSALVPV
jgi:23S rRNA (adenine2030-N6)-methyltransferase